MPHKRGSHMSAALGDCLYVMGGWDSEAYLDHLEVYDTRAGRWRSAPPLITPRAYGSTVVLDSQIYVIGGLAGTVSLLSFPSAAACHAGIPNPQCNPPHPCWRAPTALIMPCAYSSMVGLDCRPLSLAALPAR